MKVRFSVPIARRVAGGIAVIALMAPRPFTPGLTYKIRMTTKLPDFAAAFGGAVGGGGGALAGGALTLAKATASGGRAKIEFQVIEPASPGVLPDDYVLVTDSGKLISVSPASSSYREGSSISFGLSALATLGGRGGGLGGFGGGGGGGVRINVGGGGGGAGGAPPGGGPPGAASNPLDGYQVRDVHIDVQKLGAGEAIDGRPTQHYTVAVGFSVMAQGTPRPVEATIEVWTAKLPAGVINPYDVFGNSDYDKSGPAVELMAKLDATARQFDGSPVKTIVTIPIGSMMGAIGVGGGGGGGAAGRGGVDLGAAMAGLTIVQTLQLTSITPSDVDPKLLAIPVGYTKK